MYIYKFGHVHVYVHVYVQIRVYTYIDTRTWRFLRKVYTHICIHMCMYKCICIPGDSDEFLHMCVHIFAYIYMCTNLYVYLKILAETSLFVILYLIVHCKCLYICICKLLHTYVYVQMYMYTWRFLRKLAFCHPQCDRTLWVSKYVYIHICIHIFMYKCVCIPGDSCGN